MSNLGREPGDPAEQFVFDPDTELFYWEVETARFRREQQQPPEGSISRNKVYLVTCVFLAVLIVIIVLAIWFSMASQMR